MEDKRILKKFPFSFTWNFFFFFSSLLENGWAMSTNRIHANLTVFKFNLFWFKSDLFLSGVTIGLDLFFRLKIFSFWFFLFSSKCLRPFNILVEFFSISFLQTIHSQPNFSIFCTKLFKDLLTIFSSKFCLYLLSSYFQLQNVSSQKLQIIIYKSICIRCWCLCWQIL